ncbi:MAG: M20 family metallopeptidase, partial [Spirochaetales bacterium]|nr:M20 family metallopeptidase [Spirochaetales bacterium]
MNVETLKETAYTIIDQNRDAIFEVADTVWTHPETGYKEEKTGRYIARL